jgi:hypothetical protein
MKPLQLLLFSLVTTVALADAAPKAIPLNGFFASQMPAEAGESLELKAGRFSRKWFTDVGFSDTGTGLEHNPQTGSYIFDGYRLVLLGDAPLVVLIYYLVTIDGVDLLLDHDAARFYYMRGKIDSGNLLLRVPTKETQIGAHWRKVAREHPLLAKSIHAFEVLRALDTEGQ